ncbi:MAG: 23S rRNA (pseudouridine(1915)-N(3))-methyltransferase RlmH [Abyssibacter sp.]|uniref:23S rRNA (pseudouridine(1915)-N(3))-methyltransferase RlmH n=1 Tax=Abyssibacter sp. TaxID=2320200 RepID=UPI00321A79FB
MRIRLIAVGRRMPKWVVAGYEEFAKRMPRECRLELIELNPGDRSGGDVERARQTEADRILDKLGDRDHVIALDELGREATSAGWAEAFETWLHSGRDVAFIIGGPDGLDDRVLQRADVTWALAKMTLPHALVRVVVAEQLYRAWSIVSGHPYHR